MRLTATRIPIILLLDNDNCDCPNENEKRNNHSSLIFQSGSCSVDLIPPYMTNNPKYCRRYKFEEVLPNYLMPNFTCYRRIIAPMIHSFFCQGKSGSLLYYGLRDSGKDNYLFSFDVPEVVRGNLCNGEANMKKLLKNERLKPLEKNLVNLIEENRERMKSQSGVIELILNEMTRQCQINDINIKNIVVHLYHINGDKEIPLTDTPFLGLENQVELISKWMECRSITRETNSGSHIVLRFILLPDIDRPPIRAFGYRPINRIDRLPTFLLIDLEPAYHNMIEDEVKLEKESVYDTNMLLNKYRKKSYNDTNIQLLTISRFIKSIQQCSLRTTSKLRKTTSIVDRKKLKCELIKRFLNSCGRFGSENIFSQFLLNALFGTKNLRDIIKSFRNVELPNVILPRENSYNNQPLTIGQIVIIGCISTCRSHYDESLRTLNYLQGLDEQSPKTVQFPYHLNLTSLSTALITMKCAQKEKSKNCIFEKKKKQERIENTKKLLSIYLLALRNEKSFDVVHPNFIKNAGYCLADEMPTSFHSSKCYTLSTVTFDELVEKMSETDSYNIPKHLRDQPTLLEGRSNPNNKLIDDDTETTFSVPDGSEIYEVGGESESDSDVNRISDSKNKEPQIYRTPRPSLRSILKNKKSVNLEMINTDQKSVKTFTTIPLDEVELKKSKKKKLSTGTTLSVDEKYFKPARIPELPEDDEDYKRIFPINLDDITSNLSSNIDPTSEIKSGTTEGPIEAGLDSDLDVAVALDSSLRSLREKSEYKRTLALSEREVHPSRERLIIIAEDVPGRTKSLQLIRESSNRSNLDEKKSISLHELHVESRQYHIFRSKKRSRSREDSRIIRSAIIRDVGSLVHNDSSLCIDFVRYSRQRSCKASCERQSPNSFKLNQEIIPPPKTNRKVAYEKKLSNFPTSPNSPTRHEYSKKQPFQRDRFNRDRSRRRIYENKRLGKSEFRPKILDRERSYKEHIRRTRSLQAAERRKRHKHLSPDERNYPKTDNGELVRKRYPKDRKRPKKQPYRHGVGRRQSNKPISPSSYGKSSNHKEQSHREPLKRTQPKEKSSKNEHCHKTPSDYRERLERNRQNEKSFKNGHSNKTFSERREPSERTRPNEKSLKKEYSRRTASEEREPSERTRQNEKSFKKEPSNKTFSEHREPSERTRQNGKSFTNDRYYRTVSEQKEPSSSDGESSKNKRSSRKESCKKSYDKTRSCTLENKRSYRNRSYGTQSEPKRYDAQSHGKSFHSSKTPNKSQRNYRYGQTYFLDYNDYNERDDEEETERMQHPPSYDEVGDYGSPVNKAIENDVMIQTNEEAKSANKSIITGNGKKSRKSRKKERFVSQKKLVKPKALNYRKSPFTTDKNEELEGEELEKKKLFIYGNKKERVVAERRKLYNEERRLFQQHSQMRKQSAQERTEKIRRRKLSAQRDKENMKNIVPVDYRDSTNRSKSEELKTFHKSQTPEQFQEDEVKSKKTRTKRKPSFTDRSALIIAQTSNKSVQCDPESDNSVDPPYMVTIGSQAPMNIRMTNGNTFKITKKGHLKKQKKSGKKYGKKKKKKKRKRNMEKYYRNLQALSHVARISEISDEDKLIELQDLQNVETAPTVVESQTLLGDLAVTQVLSIKDDKHYSFVSPIDRFLDPRIVHQTDSKNNNSLEDLRKNSDLKENSGLVHEQFVGETRLLPSEDQATFEHAPILQHHLARVQQIDSDTASIHLHITDEKK
ncbi:hypothetical protein SNEBB_011465 [Seison nebaliae]|nr:hypothetical protein SNEBB_011465 [Seison nebaliae]